MCIRVAMGPAVVVGAAVVVAVGAGGAVVLMSGECAVVRARGAGQNGVGGGAMWASGGTTHGRDTPNQSRRRPRRGSAGASWLATTCAHSPR